MKFSNVRLLVKDFAKCFKFYSEQLGLEPAWGDENSGYAYFKVADGIEGFALFVSDWMAPSVGNADKELPVGYREKSLVAFSVDNVDDTYRALKEKGVIFVNALHGIAAQCIEQHLATVVIPYTDCVDIIEHAQRFQLFPAGLVTPSSYVLVFDR